MGLLYNMVFNRDDMIHLPNFQGCGLPFELKQQIAAEVGAMQRHRSGQELHPMNEYKANFAWWSIVTDVLHDFAHAVQLGMAHDDEPTKARDYRGDLIWRPP